MTRPKTSPTLAQLTAGNWRLRAMLYIAKEFPEHIEVAHQHLYPKIPPREDHLGSAMVAIRKAIRRKRLPDIWAWLKVVKISPDIYIFSRALITGIWVSSSPKLKPNVDGLSAPQTAKALRRAVKECNFLFDENSKTAIERAAKLYDSLPRHRPPSDKPRLTLRFLDELFQLVFGPGQHYNQALDAFARHFSGWSRGTAIRTRRRKKAPPL